MKWIELWAMLEVIGIGIGTIISLFILIPFIIETIQEHKKK
jgi:hypothetical protein